MYLNTTTSYICLEICFILGLFICLKVFTVPLEERRFKEVDDHGFGEEGDQAKICKDIMQKTGMMISYLK